MGEIPDLVPFAGWAARAGFSFVQVLPVSEVAGGETSPYAASTAFALDPIYLGLDRCEDFVLSGGRGALGPEVEERMHAAVSARAVDWQTVRTVKERALARAFRHFRDKEWASRTDRARALERFGEEHAGWLDEYALFAALHDRYQTWWRDWPVPLRDREPQALAAAQEELADAILEKRWRQWQLDSQWRQARAQAEATGVQLMGDLPFMVSIDSADVWARQQQFRLDLKVGTPPDAFSAEGQDWGLPLYDWEVMEKGGFAWLRARAKRAGELFALYRVDHVIGFYRTFYRSATDRNVSGFSPAEEPAQVKLGETVLGIMNRAGEVIAEDLGMVPPFLRPSLTRQEIPGYRVLRWEKEDDGRFRDPADWPPLSVATNGTHDIETNAEWWDALSAEEKTRLLQLRALSHLEVERPFDEQVRDALLTAVYDCPSQIAIIPFQDALGSRERVNVPGTVAPTNWTYRMAMAVEDLEADHATTERLARLAYGTRRGPRRG